MVSAAQSAVPLAFSQIAPGSPWWITALTIAGLAVHIGAGSVAILSGFGAVGARKGGTLHRLSGKVFVVSMLVMGTAGAALAIVIRQPGNIAVGIFAAYLAATAWVTVRRGEGETGSFEKFATLVPIAVCALFALWSVQAVMNGGKLYGYPAPLYFAFVPIGALFAFLDIKTIAQGGVRGLARLGRHIWRMCFAFFFAAASFFIGQQKVMPHWMHGSPVLLALGFAPLAFMIFWLIRVRIGTRFKQASA